MLKSRQAMEGTEGVAGDGAGASPDPPDLPDLPAFSRLVGEAPSFVQAIRHVTAAARAEATVLVSGETGTGKELVARAVHYLSTRAALPFVPINCGALQDTLLEGELFGHERGAYTDAGGRRPGLIKYAEKGTLFLDEVDALSLKAQVAILRVLQDKRFRPLGSNQEQQADVRVVAATNTDLQGRVESGHFRADLYYRLRILSIHLPPLRQRREDILPLTAHFLQKHGKPGRPLRLSPAAVEVLLRHTWPGNVRELENAIIRACHLCHGTEIGVDDLGLSSSAGYVNAEYGSAVSGAAGYGAAGDATDSAPLQSFRRLKQQVIAAFEKDYLARLLTAHRGNVSRAARTAGKERRDLGKLIKKYHLDPKDFGGDEGFRVF